MFGANEWLVDELYEQYLQDKNAVDPAWWDFFEDYRPAERSDADTTSDAPAAPSNGSVPAAAPANGSRPAAANGSPAPAAPTAPAPAAPTAVTDGSAAAEAAQRVKPPKLPADPAVNAAVEAVHASRPVATAQPATAPYAQVPARKVAGAPAPEDQATDDVQKLRGPAARVVTNMEASIQVPTATSVRAVPAKLMVDNRIVINNHLARGRGGKISFTHLIGFALVEALADMPVMNASYTQIEGKPAINQPAHVNFGLAIDLAKPDGSRQLLVPSIKKAETMDFAQFWAAYEDLVRRARGGKLGVDDFAGTTISLTNPGGIGTVHSVPRLMQGQGTIIGVGAMDYPAEFAGASTERLARLGISKVLTITSTYDHRIIQGAQSGEFLRILSQKLLGEDGFYDRVFAALRIPYEPVRWVRDNTTDAEIEAAKPAKIAELVHSYRSRGHLMADT
ncbi:MAG: 2-oxo acid dehydrogenase subunit E2, partial [Cellulosimicrobium funkei]